MMGWSNIRCMPSNITIRISDILESYSFPNSLGMSVDDIISRGSDGFFNFAFPWYADNGTGLEEFKSLFLHKYYMYQIGQETEGLFKLNLQSKLMEMMPTWKQLYDTTIMKYNPLVNRSVERKEVFSDNKDKTENSSSSGIGNSTNTVDGVTTNTVNGKTTGISDDTTTGDTQNIVSDNPQVTIKTQDYASKMDRGQNKVVGKVTTDETRNDTQNATNKNTTTSDSSNKMTRDNKVTDVINHDGTYNEHGYIGESQTDNIVKYRKAILNLNMEICEYLRGCFLLVY